MTGWRRWLILHLQVSPPRQTEQSTRACSPPQLALLPAEFPRLPGVCALHGADSKDQQSVSWTLVLHCARPHQHRLNLTHTGLLGTRSLTVHANSQYPCHLQTWTQGTEVRTVFKRVQLNFRWKIVRGRQLHWYHKKAVYNRLAMSICAGINLLTGARCWCFQFLARSSCATSRLCCRCA